MQRLQLDPETAIAPTSLSYNRHDWQMGYRSLPDEYSYWIEEFEGEIPPDLTGTLFRNGPGLLDVNGQRLQHPFDGDGMVCAIAFDQGRAHFRNRFVRTEGYLAEQKAGRILYRGVFGTQKPGGWLANAFDLKIKNIANTNILYWGDKLLALWEAAEPHRLDPQTLETLGLDDLNGILQAGAAFAAHPRIDPACKMDGDKPCLVNFSIKPGLSSTIALYELDPAGQLLRQHSHAIPGFAFIHDFAITPNYAIFFQNPVSFNPLPFLLGARAAGECITFRPEQKTRIVLIPRNPAETTRRVASTESSRRVASTFEIGAGFVFHHVNAFEEGDVVVVDSVCYASLPTVEAGSDYRETDFTALAPGQLWRFRLDLNAGSVDRQLLEARCCEFPVVHPAKVGRPYRYTYLAAAHAPTGNAPHQAILKVDLESGDRQLWSAAPSGYVGEPIFVPRAQATTGAEDHGWLLVMVYNAARTTSEVVILDAQDLERGAIARLHLKHHVPYGLHGSFTQQCWVERDAAV